MKKYLYKIWLVSAVSIIIILSIITNSGIAKIIAAVCGVIYVLELSKENKYAQIFGLINTIIYAFLLIGEKVYGTALYNLLYAAPLLVYTYFSWGKENNKLKISSYSPERRCYTIIIMIPIIFLYYLIATQLGVNFALVDGITVVVGGYAMYAISKKKIDQWYCWIFVNIASLIMWVMQSINDISNISMVMMYIVYIINNTYGLYAWKKKCKK